MVRPRRMVEPLEDRGQENFFCGPPGKLQRPLPDFHGGPRPHLLEQKEPEEQIWADRKGRQPAGHIQAEEVGLYLGR